MLKRKIIDRKTTTTAKFNEIVITSKTSPTCSVLQPLEKIAGLYCIGPLPPIESYAIKY